LRLLSHLRDTSKEEERDSRNRKSVFLRYVRMRQLMYKDGNEENYCGRNTNGPVSKGTEARILMGHVSDRERPGDKNENEP
jgi:hypothetical protein